MKVEDVREAVQKMRLTTPEAELLACIALTLAEVLESVIEILESVKRAEVKADELVS